MKYIPEVDFSLTLQELESEIVALKIANENLVNTLEWQRTMLLSTMNTVRMIGDLVLNRQLKNDSIPPAVGQEKNK